MTRRPLVDASAYSPLRRAKLVFKFFKTMVELGPTQFEATKSVHLARTYGLPVETVKKIKARFRCELSFPGGDK